MTPKPKDEGRPAPEMDTTEAKLRSVELEAQRLREELTVKRRKQAADLAPEIEKRLADLASKVPIATKFTVSFSGPGGGPPIVVVPQVPKSGANPGGGGRGEKRAAYMADKESGMSVAQIAKKHGVNSSTVWSALNRK